MKKTFISALSFIFIIAACEQKKPANDNNQKITASVKSTDKEQKLSNEEFFRKAYSGNTDEIQLGELAINKSVNKQITNFADMQIKDHQNANDELRTIAMDMKLKLPEGLSAEGIMEKEEWKSNNLKGFDRSYINYTIKQHEKDTILYYQAGKELTNLPLKKYANSTLKIVKKHLEKAQEISSSLENPTSIR